MGYSKSSLDYLISLYRHEVFPAGGYILELGAQELNLDVGPDALLRFLGEFGELDERADAMLALLPGGMVGEYWRLFGFNYNCIDMIDDGAAIKLDLNCDALASEYVGRFDMVTNFGTSEHICNQANVFKVVHDALKPGGCAVHMVPFNGMFNHALINYHPRFFMLLAAENDYEILSWGLSPPFSYYRIPSLDAIPGSNAWKNVEYRDGMLVVTLRKRNSNPFAVPTDRDMRYLPRDLPAGLVGGVANYVADDKAEEREAKAQPGPVSLLATAPTRPAPARSAHHQSLIDTMSKLMDWCRDSGLGTEPYALAVSKAWPDMELRCQLTDVIAAPTADRVDEWVAKVANRALATSGQTARFSDLGRAFWGIGWGPVFGDGPGYRRRWRVIGKSGVASLFLWGDINSNNEIKGIFHYRELSDAVYRLVIRVNGQAVPLVIERDGEDVCFRLVTPSNATSANERVFGGACELSWLAAALRTCVARRGKTNSLFDGLEWVPSALLILKYSLKLYRRNVNLAADDILGLSHGSFLIWLRLPVNLS
jgi:SAM-dependent methyltransferase